MKNVLILLALLGATLCNAQQYGRASWYGKKFQGHEMANGHKFDRNELTCASRRFPLGTLVNVYYPRTGRTVTLIVTDRGPWVKGRILDMSERAATELGLHPYGVDYVEVKEWHIPERLARPQKDTPALLPDPCDISTSTGSWLQPCSGGI